MKEHATILPTIKITLAAVLTTGILSASAFAASTVDSHKSVSGESVIAQAPLVSIATHDRYFTSLKKLCGKAYQGHVTVDNANSDSFANKKLVMHVRKCSDTELQIPFHVGDDASRTWILTKTGSGLSLKHDHRQSNGSYDVSTMYGGHTVDAGWANMQSFPADQ